MYLILYNIYFKPSRNIVRHFISYVVSIMLVVTCASFLQKSFSVVEERDIKVETQVLGTRSPKTYVNYIVVEVLLYPPYDFM